MKSYTIYYTLSGSIEVDASSAEEALELFENLSEDEIEMLKKVLIKMNENVKEELECMH